MATVNPPLKPRVGLFVTCLVDAVRPNIGFASIKLLEAAGCVVEVPSRQTCCGQPGYNSGADDLTVSLARQVIDTFLPYDYLVAPSGSCVGMIKEHYPSLFRRDPVWAERQRRLAGKSFELLSFLHDVMRFEPENVRYPGTACYHDSCAGLRELGVKQQPRRLLERVEGLTMTRRVGQVAFCGFVVSFCVKYPEISTAIVTDKAKQIEATNADTLLGGDLGCLMNMAGRLSRLGSSVKTFHAAEVLADMADEPLIPPAPS
ncbi:MAG: (Fe-S)-binding protein [Geminicoccaceae bacterium]